MSVDVSLRSKKRITLNWGPHNYIKEFVVFGKELSLSELFGHISGYPACEFKPGGSICYDV